MQLNIEDGANRKHIMVQLNEPVKAGSEAERAGFETIDQIGRERIRRARPGLRQTTRIRPTGATSALKPII